jgi:cob(I)alamin adenosyltransferase
MTKEFKIYTKTGDDGSTGLVGGARVKKYDVRLEAYGTVDELNAVIGVIRSYKLPEEVTEMLVEIQNKLFNIGSRLATDEKGEGFTKKLSITEKHISFLEKAIDEMEERIARAHPFYFTRRRFGGSTVPCGPNSLPKCRKKNPGVCRKRKSSIRNPEIHQPVVRFFICAGP